MATVTGLQTSALPARVRAILNTDTESQNIIKGFVPAGKSAYQVAVDNGFVGTEQAWLDSLHGSATTATAADLPAVDLVTTYSTAKA